MKRIVQLSKNLVNQIAAGEVIERPASIVKELVENSIDAGSNRIEISVANECRDIRIADNGSGIHPEDIELAFSKHATSKIREEKDLWNINTLGFRGEALASIISVAKVTCTTRPKDFEYGTKVTSQNSEITKTKTGCDYGTIMEVNDIFFNQPARLKFLKSSKTEFSYIQELVQGMAISHPEISFTLKNNGQEVIKTTQNADLLTRITEIYSSSFVDYLKPLSKTDDISNIKITGYTSIPSYTRSSKKAIYTFVNSRLIKCPVILKSIDMAYKNMMPQGKYPFVVLNLEINPEDIDVNAHPTKREIRYRNPNQIFNFVQSAVTLALRNIQSPEINQHQTESASLPFASMQEDDKDTVFVSSDIKEQQNLPSFFDLARQERPKYPSNTLTEIFKAPQKEDKEEQSDKIIGQYYNTYILIETRDGLELVDQHIADERYIYEKLKNSSEIASQMLLISDVINLEPSEVELLEEHKEKLIHFGYQIEKVSDYQVIFKKVPQMLSNVDPKEIISDLLENIKGDLNTLEEKILITTSCKAAVKAGERLTMWQMEELIKKWRKTKTPYTCPHGRPITKTIPLKEIASFFNRNA